MKRNLNDSVFGGVCSGIADTLKIKSIYIRILFVILGILTIWTIPIYILLWIILKPKNL